MAELERIAAERDKLRRLNKTLKSRNAELEGVIEDFVEARNALYWSVEGAIGTQRRKDVTAKRASENLGDAINAMEYVMNHAPNDPDAISSAVYRLIVVAESTNGVFMNAWEALGLDLADLERTHDDFVRSAGGDWAGQGDDPYDPATIDRDDEAAEAYLDQLDSHEVLFAPLH